MVVRYSQLLKNFPQFVVIHTIKGFGIVNKAEVDIFLELAWFFYDPTDIGNLISGSSSFSKSSSNIWKFLVHILLKPHLENFEAVYCHLAYLTYMQNTSCKMMDWMKHKLESRFLGEYQ